MLALHLACPQTISPLRLKSRAHTPTTVEVVLRLRQTSSSLSCVRSLRSDLAAPRTSTSAGRGRHRCPFSSGRRGTSKRRRLSFTRGSLDSTALARDMPVRLHSSCSRSGFGRALHASCSRSGSGRASPQPSAPGPGDIAPTNSARARQTKRRHGRPIRRVALVPARPPPSALCPAALRTVSSAAMRASACDGARTRAGRGWQTRAPC